jgi:PPOX class probable F420-dependent enzyme
MITMGTTSHASSGDIDQVTHTMREILGHQLYAVLCTHNADGSIHAVPVIYQYADGQLFIATSSTTHKARNVAVRSEVTVTVEDRENVRWVSAVGHAELIRGDHSRELNDRLYRLWMTVDGVDVIGSILADDEDVTIVVTPRRWLTWDIETGLYEPLRDAGIPVDEPRRWFRLDRTAGARESGH